MLHSQWKEDCNAYFHDFRTQPVSDRKIISERKRILPLDTDTLRNSGKKRYIAIFRLLCNFYWALEIENIQRFQVYAGSNDCVNNHLQYISFYDARFWPDLG